MLFDCKSLKHSLSLWFTCSFDWSEEKSEKNERKNWIFHVIVLKMYLITLFVHYLKSIESNSLNVHASLNANYITIDLSMNSAFL